MTQPPALPALDLGQPIEALPAKAPFMVLAFSVEVASEWRDPLTGNPTLWEAGRSYAIVCKPLLDIAPSAEAAHAAIVAALNPDGVFDETMRFHDEGWTNTPCGLAQVMSGTGVMRTAKTGYESEWRHNAFGMIRAWETNFSATNAATLFEQGVLGKIWSFVETQEWTPGSPMEDLGPEIGAHCALIDVQALNEVVAEHNQSDRVAAACEPGASPFAKKNEKKPRSL